MHVSIDIHGPWGIFHRESYVSNRQAFRDELNRAFADARRDKRITRIEWDLYVKWGGDLIDSGSHQVNV